MARRNAGRSSTQRSAPMGRSCYTSKNALSKWLVCGEVRNAVPKVQLKREGKELFDSYVVMKINIISKSGAKLTFVCNKTKVQENLQRVIF